MEAPGAHRPNQKSKKQKQIKWTTKERQEGKEEERRKKRNRKKRGVQEEIFHKSRA